MAASPASRAQLLARCTPSPAHASSLFEVVTRLAREASTAIAAVDAIASGRSSPLPQTLSYGELHAAAELLAGALAVQLRLRETGASPTVATWMRRGNEWYCAFCACARLQVPVVALSGDLPDKAAEAARNEEILRGHRPAVLVVDDSAGAVEHACTVAFAELWAISLGSVPAPAIVATPEALLCLCYTGGTTKASRCARVTHGMALHEVAAYPKIVSHGRGGRVLQQHSLYWAASAYGEVDIALAFGCALVFCEAWCVEDVAGAIWEHGATCAGLVPSVLAALEPQDVPSLQLIFTWGEALQVRTASAWSQHARVLDLLISTECWLSLYADWSCGPADGHDRPAFRPVPGAEVRLRPSGASKELLVGGPMVFPGYADLAKVTEPFTEEEGRRWYWTRDCMEPCSGGYVFTGRADDLVKVGGVWVDLGEVERRARAVQGVADVCICRRDVFAVLEALPDGAVTALRRVLPPDFALFLVPALPRRVGTEKVDRRRLLELVGVGTVPERLDAERAACERERATLRRWYRLLYPVGVAALAHAGQSYMMGDGAAGWDEVPGIVVHLGLRTSWELCWRLLCCVYAVLFTLHHPMLRDKCGLYCPFGACGACVALCALLPDALCAVVAAPGICLAARGGRITSWPAVCLLGLPLWAQQDGQWWAQQSFGGLACWYTRVVAQGLCRVASAGALAFGCARTGLGRSLRRLMRCEKQCHSCRVRCASGAGRVDPSVDSFWYCDACWSFYRKHRPCGSCRKWCTTGCEEDGTWVCRSCSEGRSGGGGGHIGSSGSSGGSVRLAARSPGTWVGGYAAHGGGREDCDRPLVESRVVVVEPLSGAEAPLINTLISGGSPRITEADSYDGASGAQKEVRDESMKRKPAELEMPPSADSAAGGLGEASPSKRQALSPCEDPPLSESADVAASATKTLEWRLIERSTGWAFSSLGDSLTSLDSLRTTKMTSALRRETGRRLPRETLRRCVTLGALLEEIQKLPTEILDGQGACASANPAASPNSATPVWGMMWNGRCSWVLQRDRPLAEPTLRAALAGLAERHPALRVELCDPIELFTETQRALTALELWLRGTEHSCWAALCSRAARWSFHKSWPRVRARPLPVELPLRVLAREGSLESAKTAVWHGAGFLPPFQATLAPYGAEADEGALLLIRVTHMFSDGYSVLPLLSDLAHLVARHEGGDLPPLPPVPSVFAALEPRLVRTIQGDNSLHDAFTRETLRNTSWSRETQTVLATLPAQTVAALRRGARRLEVSDEISLLTVIGVAIARLEGQTTVPITLLAPQRDGPGEADMIGLFTDGRQVNVCTDGLSFAGAALRLHHIVKERLWREPYTHTQLQNTFVNFEWTDLESCHGFSQFVEADERRERTDNPLKVAVDQPSKGTWRLRVAFDKHLYPAERRDSFFDHFEDGIRQIAEEPLAPVWPGGAPPAAGTSLGRPRPDGQR